MDEEVEKIILKSSTNKTKCLNLSHRLLTVIPENFSGITSVKQLLLNDNKLIFPPTEILLFGNSLTELILDNNKLTILPAGLGALKHLQVFSLNNNNVGALPSEIGDLKSLKELWLNHCSLLSLPSEIGNLHSLLRLGLRNNKLDSLPYEFKNLNCLHWLNCSDNNLSDFSNLYLPDELHFLGLDNNRFEFVPLSVRGKQHLKVLLLCGNKISSLSDDALLELNQVFKLDLRENPMNSLPQHWKGMSHILIGPRKEPTFEHSSSDNG